MSYYLWRVYCINSNDFETVVSDTEPTVCPSDAGPIDPSQTVILETNFINIYTNSYINIESTLADNQALKIRASDTNGGIDIVAGFGGISASTTNAIALAANAASSFVTGNGNLTLSATTGLTNIDGGSGINVGNAVGTPGVFVGTIGANKNINIGNLTGTTTVNIDAGTGGINLDTGSGGAISLDAVGASSNFTLSSTANNQDLSIALLGSTDSSVFVQSSGTGVDAIKLNTSQGGIEIIAYGGTSNVNIANEYSGTGNIKASSGPGNGGSLTLESGSAGISLNAYQSGLIGIGGFTGGDVYVATNPVSRTVKVGNNTGTTQFFQRFGTGGLIKSQTDPTIINSSATLTVAEILTGIVISDPLVALNLQLPSAATIVAGIPGVEVNDAVDLVVINISLSFIVTILTGAGITSAGGLSIIASNSSWYRIRITNVTGGFETCQILKLA